MKPVCLPVVWRVPMPSIQFVRLHEEVADRQNVTHVLAPADARRRARRSSVDDAGGVVGAVLADVAVDGRQNETATSGLSKRGDDQTQQRFALATTRRGTGCRPQVCPRRRAGRCCCLKNNARSTWRTHLSSNSNNYQNVQLQADRWFQTSAGPRFYMQTH